jgi:hypothetical protein
MFTSYFVQFEVTPCLVAQIYNPSYWEEEIISRIQVREQPTKKLSKTPSLQISEVWYFMSNKIPAMQEAVGRKNNIRGWPSINIRLYPKNN